MVDVEGARSLSVGDVVVASAVDGTGMPAALAPRPYLHPVRTLGGTVVSAHRPPDHAWHCGVGVAIPDLDGVNCWGGPTYVHGAGYVNRDDHGRVDVRRTRRDGPGLVHDLVWRGPEGAELLLEERRLGWRGVADGWELTWTSAFRCPGAVEVRLGSPGSNGRAGAGYGGFTWRFPACSAVRVRTEHASGEAATHGSVAPWIEWRAAFPGGDAVVRIEALDHDDPWFVRVAEYPALGSALAWDEPVRVRPGSPLVRSFRATVRDA